MAFALLANLPAVNGLYSSFFPLLTYFFLGGIHQMVPGKASPLSVVGVTRTLRRGDMAKGVAFS
jgi:sulfate anion transporter 9